MEVFFTELILKIPFSRDGALVELIVRHTVVLNIVKCISKFLNTSSVVKGQNIPVYTWTGPEGSRIARQSVHEGGKVLSPRHRLPLPTMKYFWYSFLLQAESTAEL